MSSRRIASIDRIDETSIPFRFRIDNLLLFIGVIFVVVASFHYFVYSMQGGWIGAMPMLTEIASSFPSGVLFSSVFTALAFLSLLVAMAVMNWGEIYGVFKSKFITFGQVISFLCVAFLVVLANCRPDDASWAIYVGPTPFSVLTLIFFWVIFVRSFRSLTMAFKIARGLILVAASVLLLFAVLPIQGNWIVHCTVRSACLLGFTTLIVVFFVSFMRELRQLRVDFVIFSDD
jgi:hypothetical protein